MKPYSRKGHILHFYAEGRFDVTIDAEELPSPADRRSFCQGLSAASWPAYETGIARYCWGHWTMTDAGFIGDEYSPGPTNACSPHLVRTSCLPIATIFSRYLDSCA